MRNITQDAGSRPVSAIGSFIITMELKLPNYKYSVNPFGVEGVQFDLETRPNIFRRFWMWLIFGWRFKPWN